MNILWRKTQKIWLVFIIGKLLYVTKVHAFFFINNAFFMNFHEFMSFSRTELWMFFRYCLIHITIIILRHNLYILCLCPCLDLDLFMPHLCDLFFISSLILIVINYITWFKLTYLFFWNIFYYFRMITWIKKVNNFEITKGKFQGIA